MYVCKAENENKCDGNNNAFCIGPDDDINARLLTRFLKVSDPDNCPVHDNYVAIGTSDD